MNPALRHPVTIARSHVELRAFTLIELLTVIAIIGILAAIMIPVVGRVRESAHSAQCASNLRQIFGALQMFANDNKDGILRWVDHKPGVPGHSVSWNGVLSRSVGVTPSDGYDYIPNYAMGKLWRCASNKEGQMKVGETVFETDDTKRYGFNYAINAIVAGASSDGRRGPSYPYNEADPQQRNRLSDIASPSRTIAVCDGKTWLIHDTSGGNKATPAGVHNGGMNAVFWDGHVQKFTTILPLRDPRFSMSGQ